MTESSRILTVLTNPLTNSIAREVVTEAEAVAEAVDEDEATKAVSHVKMTVRTSRNACLTKNISIAKITTSALTIVVLATLEVITTYLVTLNATSY